MVFASAPVYIGDSISVNNTKINVLGINSLSDKFVCEVWECGQYKEIAEMDYAKLKELKELSYWNYRRI